MVKDLTTGSPARLIIGFSLPLLAGNLFQQFYSMADTIVVGRSIGVDALAAVGSTGAISFLVLGFVIGLTGGFSVVVAQKFGAGDEREVRRAVAMSVYLSVLLTIVLTAVSVLCTRPLLNFMQTPANIYDDAYAYIVVIFAGTGAIIFYNLLSGVLRALGDSRTPLYFLILSSVINVALDLVFILVFGMGVAGAAYATVAAQVLSGLLCLLYMAKKFPILRFHKSDWAWNGRLVVHHLRLGLPMAFQFSVTAIGVMILQGAINGFGSSVVAGYTAASKVEQLTTQPMMTFGITMATYGGQNLGAGRLDRIRQGTRRCVEISTVVNLACAVPWQIPGAAVPVQRQRRRVGGGHRRGYPIYEHHRGVFCGAGPAVHFPQRAAGGGQHARASAGRVYRARHAHGGGVHPAPLHRIHRGLPGQPRGLDRRDHPACHRVSVRHAAHGAAPAGGGDDVGTSII